MLTTKKIEQNKTTFIETNEKYGIMTKELLDFLGEDLFIAPSTISLNMTGSYPGGLLQITIRACKYAIMTNEILPTNLKHPIESIVKTVFLSQIGKVFMFRLTENESLKKKGQLYEFSDDLIRLRVGERSVYYALQHGVTLTEEEFQAIINYDKDDDDKMAKYYSSSLSSIIRWGFEIAVMEEKNEKK